MISSHCVRLNEQNRTHPRYDHHIFFTVLQSVSWSAWDVPMTARSLSSSRYGHLVWQTQSIFSTPVVSPLSYPAHTWDG